MYVFDRAQGVIASRISRLRAIHLVEFSSPRDPRPTTGCWCACIPQHFSSLRYSAHTGDQWVGTASTFFVKKQHQCGRVPQIVEGKTKSARFLFLFSFSQVIFFEDYIYIYLSQVTFKIKFRLRAIFVQKAQAAFYTKKAWPTLKRKVQARRTAR